MNVLVTGATSGIGLATAHALAARGHRVWVHGRNAERCARALASLRAAAPAAECHAQPCDLASLDAVREWARRLRHDAAPIDVIVHNAGVWMREPTRTVDGFETTWAVNHLAPFLLTHLLLDGLLARPDARVVTVSSMAHRMGQIRLDDPNLTGGFTAQRAYSQSKLANVLFTQELARRTAGTSLVAHALHPGVIQTAMVQRTGFTNLDTKPPAQGATTPVFLATDPTATQSSGGYWVDARPEAPQSTPPHVASRLWALSLRQCGLA